LCGGQGAVFRRLATPKRVQVQHFGNQP
jgi:hypothetical protein